MKILLINTYDRGGAANACLRLHKGLLEIGVESKLLLLYKSKNIDYTYQFVFEKINKFSFKWWVAKCKSRLFKYSGIGLFDSRAYFNDFCSKRDYDLDMFSHHYTDYDITKSELYQEADIINLHWVAGFVDLKKFFLKNRKPVVWTFHDMAAFTSGEHYLEWYGQISSKGLPTLRSFTNSEIYWKNKLLKVKKNIYNSVENLTIVTPSKWLTTESNDSKMFGVKNAITVPYGLNTRVYKLLSQDIARNALGLPLDKRIVLFVAQLFVKRRKGLGYLKNAINQLDLKNVVLCTVGEIHTSFLDSDSTIELGTINDETKMAMVYNAADVFIIPSLMDNLPNTVIESLSCGTPVIGFPVGGILDMIKPGFNGLLTNEISVSSLRNTIQTFIDMETSFDRNEISKDAHAKYSLEIQAKEYKDIFTESLK